MNTLALMGTGAGLGAMSGINLYLTTLVTGVAVHFNLLQLSDKYHDLALLGSPWIIGAAATLYLIEFCADKMPWLDSVWDAAHTFIRPVGAAILGLKAFGSLSPEMGAIGALLAGGFGLTTHAAKASTRVIANASPEPFSNIALSVGEDIIVLGGVATAFIFPTVALVCAAVLVVGIWVILPKMWRMAKKAKATIKARLLGKQRSLVEVSA